MTSFILLELHLTCLQLKHISYISSTKHKEEPKECKVNTKNITFCLRTKSTYYRDTLK